jgi:hypothetical protein
MRYFHVRDENSLAVVRSFAFWQGQAPLIQTPTFGGDVFHRGRPEPDTFTMDATGLGQLGGAFRVVDEDFTVYECIGTNVSGGNGGMAVSGLVTARWHIEDANRDEALRMMREATGA